MADKDDELALRIRDDILRAETVRRDIDGRSFCIEFARRYLAAWQTQQEPLAIIVFDLRYVGDKLVEKRRPQKFSLGVDLMQFDPGTKLYAAPIAPAVVSDAEIAGLLERLDATSVFSTDIPSVSAAAIRSLLTRVEDERKAREEQVSVYVALANAHSERAEAAEQHCARIEAIVKDFYVSMKSLEGGDTSFYRAEIPRSELNKLRHIVAGAEKAVAAQEKLTEAHPPCTGASEPVSATATDEAEKTAQDCYIGTKVHQDRSNDPPPMLDYATNEALRPDDYKPQEGIWMLVSPDGNSWDGDSPLQCVRRESEERIPPTVRLAQIKAACEPTAEDLAEQEALRLEGMEQAAKICIRRSDLHKAKMQDGQRAAREHGIASVEAAACASALRAEIARRKGPEEP